MRSVDGFDRSVDCGGIGVRHREAAGLHDREDARGAGKSAFTAGNGVGFRKCDGGRRHNRDSCKPGGQFIAIGGRPCALPGAGRWTEHPIGRHSESTQMGGVACGVEMVVGRLEFSSGEERYQREPAHDETPERIFERRWALSVLDRVVERLRSEFVQHGRPVHFERLKVSLLGQSDAPYAELARELNTSEGALKVAIHRLRKRYRELFRQEIADTVADPAEVESELRYLAVVLARK